MSATQLALPTMISTDMLAAHDRFDAWRETFALRMIRVDVTTSDRAAFRAAMGVLPLDRLTLVNCDVERVGLVRTRELVRDGNDDLSLVLCTSGAVEARFEIGTATLAPGEATLVPHHLVGAVVCEQSTTSLSLRLSRALLRELLGPSRELPLRVIPRGNPALQLLITYASGIVLSDVTQRGTTAALAGRQLSELIAHLFDPTADIVRAEQFGGVKAARLQAIMAGIDRHLVDPALSAAWLGAKLALSERYVHHLLSEAGVGFARVVREKRLQRARQMLQARSARTRPVVDIAHAAGFNDLPNFNRAFRQHFGRTPSEVRRGS
jgi:AraC-like DNA-binding protein